MAYAAADAACLFPLHAALHTHATAHATDAAALAPLGNVSAEARDEARLTKAEVVVVASKSAIEAAAGGSEAGGRRQTAAGGGGGSLRRGERGREGDADDAELMQVTYYRAATQLLLGCFLLSA